MQIALKGRNDDALTRGGTHMEVRMPKAPLLKCLTCPLCSYLLREATTISECLHTFCRDCITAELSHGESECCPVCEVGLGTLPLEKLRADHQLNDLKEKLFPSNAKKRKPTGSPGTSNATRRKERSLYSLGVKDPPAVNPGYATRKTRALPGTQSKSSRMDEGQLEDEGDDDDEEDNMSDDSPTTILKLSHNGGSEALEAKVYPQSEPRRRAEDLALTPRGDGERGSSAGPKVSHRLSVSNGNKASGSLPGPRIVRGSRKSNGSATPGSRGPPPVDFPSKLDALALAADANAALEATVPASPSPPPDLRITPVQTKGGSSLKESSPAATNGQSLQSRLKQSLNGVIDRPPILRTARPFSGAGQSSKTSANGIWFHLESGDLQANEDALPPLASPYVRIKDLKDGKLQVYHVKTYLVHKLSHKVKSEMEVEITCRGQPVVSRLPLESIRDIWFSAQISDQPQAQAQAQAQGETSTAPANGTDFPTSKDFVMVLTYRRHRKPRIN